MCILTIKMHEENHILSASRSQRDHAISPYPSTSVENVVFLTHWAECEYVNSQMFL